MADVTEMGGVMMPSASSVPAPIMAGNSSHRPRFFTSENNEKMPPSPWLSASSVSMMYLTVVCRVSVQNTADTPPYTNSSLTGRSPTMVWNT